MSFVNKNSVQRGRWLKGSGVLGLMIFFPLGTNIIYHQQFCNNVAFRAESFQTRNHVTTTNHNFTSSGLTSITALGSFSSTSLGRRRSVSPYLNHIVGGTSTYKSEEYFVERVLGMI